MDFSLAAKAFIVDGNENLLVIKRRPNDPNRPGIWEIPGGRLDTGENPFDGVKRETLEEVGVDVDVLDPLDVHHFTRDDGQRITMIVFLCRPKTSEVKLSEEHTEFKWVPMKDVEDNISHFFHDTVETYQNVYGGKEW